MKVKNKKNNEVGTLEIVVPEKGVADEALIFDEVSGDILGRASSIAELYEEWEDYEEPKEYWCIDWTGGVNSITVLDGSDQYEDNKKEIGNYFETEEEAERAVEKLKAWKRLKDKGFKFKSWETNEGIVHIETSFNAWDDINRETIEDIDTLFGSNNEETWVL